jgi:hypothetical protein
MAKEVKVSIIVDDNGSMRLTEKSAKKLGGGMDRVARSAASADRNLKGAAAASSNSTKNFSKMSQGISSGLVPAYATLAANVFAVQAVFLAFRNSADVTNLIEGQKALGAVTGVAYKTITNSLRDATNGMLSFKEAATAAAIGTAGGLTSGQLTDLASAAKNASAVLGRDLTDSFNRLIRGVTKAEPELLDELGIILRLETASLKYAKAMGITGRQLTTFEKQQAVTNEVLEQAGDKYGKIADIMDPMGQSVNRLGASFDELLLPLQTGLTKYAAPFFDFLSKNLGALTAVLSVVGLNFLNGFLPAIPVMKDLGGSVEQASKNVYALGNANSKTFKTINKNGAFQLSQLKVLEKAAMAKTSTVLRGSAAERRGVLKDIRIMMAAEKTRIAEASTGLKRYFLLGTAGYARLTAAHGKFMGTVKAGTLILGGALRALPYIGLIFLFKDAAVALYEFLNPIPEATKKANDATDKFTQSAKILNEELQRSVDVRKEVSLGLKEYVLQIGNATKSADILRKIVAFENLGDADIEKKKEALAELTNTIGLLAKLDPRFQKFVDKVKALENGQEFTAKDELSLLTSRIIEGATALEHWEQTVKNVGESISKVINVKAINPFQDIIDTVKTATSDAGKIVPELESRLQASYGEAEAKGRLTEGLKRAKDRAGEGLVSAQAFADSMPASSIRSEADSQNYLYFQSLLEDAIKLVDDTTNAWLRHHKELDANLKSSKELLDSVNAYKAEQLRMIRFSEELAKRDTEIQDIAKNKLTLQKQLVMSTTKGVTTQEKLQNIQNNGLSRQLELLNQKNSVIAAEVQLASLLKSKADGDATITQEMIDAAQHALRLANSKTDQIVHQQGIQRELNALEELNLELAEKRLRLDIKRVETSISLAANERALNKVKSGAGTGNFGFAQIKKEAAAQEMLLKGKESVAMASYNIAKQTADDLALKVLLNGEDATQANLAGAKMREAWQQVKAAEQELEIFRARGQTLQNSLYGKTEELRLQNESLFLTGEENHLAAAKLMLMKQGLDLTPEAIALASAELKTQEDIGRVMKAKKDLVGSFTDAMSAGINGMIQGTMSLKDAFKNMALSVLKMLSNIITQMLVMRFLGSAFGMGITSGLGSISSTIAAPPAARNGGVFSAGKKMGGYADGGIAKGSTSGYPAILHGTEAVVPLPDGKSIPVSMNGSGQNNNVTVNVSMDGQGGSSSDSSSNGQKGANIGKLIAGAVQEELQRQKRPGGILSPYGAA